MKKSKIVGLVGTLSAAAILLAACGSSSDSSSEKTQKDDNKMMTVTVYDDLANYQGIQSGWFGKLVKDKFHMKLNIVAPNVAGGGSTLFDTRSAAGNLGDIIITGAANGRVKKLVDSGLVSDMTPYLKDAKYIKKYKNATKALDKLAGKKNGVWGIPDQVSSQSPTTPSEGNDLTYGPYIRWDYYKAIGYPKIKNTTDLLNVLKKMQEYARKQNPGKKIYAFSLFKDWDGSVMNNAVQFADMYGYNNDSTGFVLAKGNKADYQSVISSNRQYVKALRLLNKASQMGLVDPDSSTQNYDTLFSKYQGGEVLFSFWPFLGQSAYNTSANQAKGEGFALAPLQNMKLLSYGATPNGTGTFIALGSKAKNKQRIVKFINWLYSPEGVSTVNSGPKGMTWTIKNNKPVLTSYGQKALLTDSSAKVPSKYGTGAYKDGVSALNYPAVLSTDKDPRTSEGYIYTVWSSVVKQNMSTKLFKDWTAHMGGAKTSVEYVKKHHNIVVAPGATYIAPESSSEISTLRNQIQTQIVNDSWKMVLSKNTSAFNSVLSNMQSTVKGLGYDKVLKVDMKNAKDQRQARANILKQYENK